MKTNVNACAEEFLRHLRESRADSLQLLHRSVIKPSRKVYRLVVGRCCYTLKLDMAPDGWASLSNEYNRLCNLSSQTAHVAGFRVARPIYSSEARNFYVTEFYEGKPVQMAMRDASSLSECLSILRAIGQWMRVLHSTSDTETRPLWPGWALEPLRLQVRPRSKFTQLFVREALVHRCMQILEDKCTQLKGKPTVFAVQHGDLSGSNLLYGKEGVLGLDFGEPILRISSVEFGHLFLHALYSRRFLAAEPTILPKSVFAAFQEGYGSDIDREEAVFFMIASLTKKYALARSRRILLSSFQRQRHTLIECLLSRVVEKEQL